MSRSTAAGETIAMKKPSKHLIAEVPRSVTKVELTIGIDPGDVWSHYCTLNMTLREFACRRRAVSGGDVFTTGFVEGAR